MKIIVKVKLSNKHTNHYTLDQNILMIIKFKDTLTNHLPKDFTLEKSFIIDTDMILVITLTQEVIPK
jgi:hypothetical protein